MANPLSIYRVYASNLTSIESLKSANLDKELHIVLAFARDYDGNGQNTTGQFEPYFEIGELNARAIRAIKDESEFTEVKFFLSIGGRNPKFPYAVTSAQETTWIKNATLSLKQMVQNYGFDGIDVYYEHINHNADAHFVKPIFSVISDLKKHNVISAASITVPARLNNRYQELFHVNDRIFNYVVLQTHTQPALISNFDDLVATFNRLRYPDQKILAGHSFVPNDWATVPPPVFTGAVPQLLDRGFGISKWIVNPNDPKNPEA